MVDMPFFPHQLTPKNLRDSFLICLLSSRESTSGLTMEMSSRRSDQDLAGFRAFPVVSLDLYSKYYV